MTYLEPKKVNEPTNLSRPNAARSNLNNAGLLPIEIEAELDFESYFYNVNRYKPLTASNKGSLIIDFVPNVAHRCASFAKEEQRLVNGLLFFVSCIHLLTHLFVGQ